MDEEEGGAVGRDAVEDDTVEREGDAVEGVGDAVEGRLRGKRAFVIRVIRFTVGCIKAVWVECM